MNDKFSIYLNFLRASAAIVVFLGHFPPGTTVALLEEELNTGYDAVIIFFVLSGYVITFSAINVDKSIFNYAFSRATRIFPVAIGSIVISYIFLLLASKYNMPISANDKIQLSHPVVISFVNSLFLGQIWFHDIRPFGNGPYWSLPFEVYDYIFFGFFYFFNGTRRITLCLLCGIFFGLKFLLLLPVWLLGSIAFKMSEHKIPNKISILLSLAPVPTYVALKAFLPSNFFYIHCGEIIEKYIGHGLDGAANFLWAYILATLFCAHLIGTKNLLNYIQIDLRIKKPINFIASISFSLYLVHYPIAIFLCSVFHKAPNKLNPQEALQIYVTVGICVTLFASQLEWKRKRLKTTFSKFYTVISSALVRNNSK